MTTASAPGRRIRALVEPGGCDPFFPVRNGEALARAIPGARLLALEQAATVIPEAATGEVAGAKLALKASKRIPLRHGSRRQSVSTPCATRPAQVCHSTSARHWADSGGPA